MWVLPRVAQAQPEGPFMLCMIRSGEGTWDLEMLPKAETDSNAIALHHEMCSVTGTSADDAHGQLHQTLEEKPKRCPPAFYSPGPVFVNEEIVLNMRGFEDRSACLFGNSAALQGFLVMLLLVLRLG